MELWDRWFVAHIQKKNYASYCPYRHIEFCRVLPLLVRLVMSALRLKVYLDGIWMTMMAEMPLSQ